MRIHRFGSLRIVATKCTDGDAAVAWERALADALAGVGGALFALDPPAPAGRPGAGHSHVAVIGDDASLPIDPTHRVHQADIRTDTWVRHGHGETVDADTPVTGLIVAEVLPTDPAVAEDWDRWYDTVHLPDMMRCGAFASGTRWRRPTARPGSANHLTVYEVTDRPVNEAVEASAAIMPDLVAGGRKHPAHAGGLTMALSRV